MRKSDKKIDNQLRLALTDVCETALKEFTGFEWLTHTANYGNFPKSLKIVCVFDTNKNLSDFKKNNSSHELSVLLQKALFEVDINLKSITPHLLYDTEENCSQNHNGNWAKRLAK